MTAFFHQFSRLPEAILCSIFGSGSGPWLIPCGAAIPRDRTEDSPAARSAVRCMRFILNFLRVSPVARSSGNGVTPSNYCICITVVYAIVWPPGKRIRFLQNDVSRVVEVGRGRRGR